MWRVILLVFCYHVLSQPVTDKTSTRHTRELIECCPCPGSNQRSSNYGSQDMLGRSSDDCPCRLRSSDSEGASSMFFPSNTAPGKTSNSVPFMRSNDPKDDMKNLLEPEVGLATSMLQTLRDATEEEYRDALARDAARAVDPMPEESARNVVIIVKPRADEEDFMSEASNVKEARCIHPLGSTIGKMRTVSKPLKSLPDFLRLPKARQPFTQRNLWDMDSSVGASNFKASVVDIDGDAPEPQQRPPLFKLTPLKENQWKNSINTDGLKVPSVFSKLEQSLKNRPNLFERFNLPLIPKIKVDSPIRKADNDINTKNDLSLAPSNVKEIIDGEEKGLFKFNKRPLMLKNLLKLKDVEFVPKTSHKRPISKSNLSNKESLNRDADDKCEYDSAMNEKVLMPKNLPAEIKKNQVQNETNVNTRETQQDLAKIFENGQDTLTSPSDMQQTVFNNAQVNTVEFDKIYCDKFSSEEISTSTTESIPNILTDDETINPTEKSVIDDNFEHEGDIDPFCETVEVKENEDADTDSSNNIGQVVSNTSHDNKDSLCLSQLQNPEQETTIFPTANENEDLTIKPIPLLSESLSTIRENVKKSLENFKITSNNKITEKLQEDRKTETPIIDDQDKNSLNNESVEGKENSNSEVTESIDQVTFKDLQKLSDDILSLSSKKHQPFTPKEAEVKDKLEDHNETELQFTNAEPTTTSNLETPKAESRKPTEEYACRIGINANNINQKPIQRTKSERDDENSKDMSFEASERTANILPAILDPLNLNKKLGSSLLSNLDPLNLSEKLRSPVLPDIDSLNLNEKLASPLLQGIDTLNLNEKLGFPILSDIEPLNLNERIGSSLLPNLDPLNVKSSFQDIIVQPTVSEDPLNFLGKPIAEVLKLPTLEDIRQRLSTVFDGNDRSAENNYSDEDGDCTNNAPEMASAASTTKFQKVPSLRPSENFNVDIFQLNPLSSSQPDFSTKVPRLYLNNFRAKLPIPNNLDLKPVKLESRVANNNNILGASLTFGNDKSTSRKTKPTHFSLLEQPLGNLPTLDELRNTLHSGTHNMLGTHLKPNLDLFRNSNFGSGSVPDITEISRNAEKTMKGLQQRMKSTFQGGKLHNPLSENIARPQDLLEDINDKLKAIHYDLNDRLSTIHEDFLDNSRLKPLVNPSRIPTFSTNRNSNHNAMNTIRIPKGKPARLLTSASTISSHEMNPFENESNDRNLLRSQTKSNPKRVQTNPHRTLLGADSSPIPTKIELLKPRSLKDISTKPTLPQLSQRLPSLRQGAETLFPQNIRGKASDLPRKSSFVKDLKRPILKKPNPFKDSNSKVTITFATTTPNPVTTPIDKFGTEPPIKVNKPGIHIKPNSESFIEKLAQHKPKIEQSATDLTPLEIPTPSKSKNNFKTASSDINDLPQLQSLEPIDGTKSRLSSLKGIRDSKLRMNEHDTNRLNAVRAFNDKPEVKSLEVTKPLGWPKSGEDSFLAKVREAMQARLNSFNPAKTSEKFKVTKVEDMNNSNTDMTRSASEISDIIAEEPLKENVSYKCKMVCTREYS